MDKTMNIKSLTGSETEKLLDILLVAFGSWDNMCRAIRNNLMALFMVDAGVRVGELIKLLLSDVTINYEPRTALIVRAEITKTKTERIVPLTERIRKGIDKLRLLQFRQPDTQLSDPFFTSRQDEDPLSVRQVERIIGKGGWASIGRKVTPHMLRHTFATKLMRTTNIRVVQTLLGHKHLTSTQIYTHPNHEDLTEAIENLAKM